MSGADAGKVDIGTTGALTFKAKPDFEAPTDVNKNNVYEVTVRAGDGNRGEMAVKVTVENETGTVSLSRTQIRVGVPVTASLSDPDGSVSGLTWQWYDGNFNANDLTQNAIGDANSDTYTQVADDDGDTLTAVASYTDGHGSGKSEEGAASSVVAVDTRNRAPVFEDQDAETDGVQNESTTRKVGENTEAVAADDALANASEDVADNVGGVITATDPDPNTEALIYTLGGANADKFRVRSNGQIEVGAGTELDYETQDTYMVTVMAEDSFGESASIAVTIMVTDVDEEPEIRKVTTVGNVAPEFPSATAARMVAENTAAGENIGTPVRATDANGDSLTYRLSGTDAASFDIDAATGQLMTLAALDYETKSTYSVTVTARDSGGLSDSIGVTVTVTDVDETPVITGDAAPNYAENGTGPVATYSATDPESATITWSLEGDDAADFEISSGGELTFKSSPDYEAEADADTDNAYEVTVVASDPAGNEARMEVTITVTDVDEMQPAFDPLAQYDADDSGAIEKDEVIQAINDYLFGVGADAISKDHVIETINLYLFG